MLSVAIHYATLYSFRSIKLPISLYKPPVLMQSPSKAPEQGNYDRVGDTKLFAEFYFILFIFPYWSHVGKFIDSVLAR